MKKIFLTIFLLFLIQNFAFSEEVNIYANKNKFGLEDINKNQITKPIYQKLIKIGEKDIYLAQKRGRFGLINTKGEVVVPIKNYQAERLFSKYAKLKNSKYWGLYDENGVNIIPQKYTLIEPLFSKMYLVKKDYKYGILDFNGNVLLNNDYEDIYMPNPKVVRVKYEGEWFEIKKSDKNKFEFPKKTENVVYKDDLEITKITDYAINTSEYSVVSFADYTLKVFSSLSPAYEETIDELMLSKGAETVSILMKMSWLPKFPFVFGNKYYHHFKNPYNGPLGNIKANIKQKM